MKKILCWDDEKPIPKEVMEEYTKNRIGMANYALQLMAKEK